MTLDPRVGRWSPAILLLLILILIVASLAVGPAPVSLSAAIADWWHGRGTTAAIVFVEIRLPRTLLGLLTGAVLGLAGAALQGLLRNPLSEPGLIGISPCAALGTVIVFYYGLTNLHPLALPLGGIAGAAVGLALIRALAGQGGGVMTLILAGVAIGSLASALTSLALSLSPNPYALTEIVFWLMGSLADRSVEHVLLAAPFMVVGMALLLSVGRSLDALSLGEDTARSLGYPMDKVANRVVIGTTLAVGAAVAVTGAVGFVGLIVPHILRPLVGNVPSRLLPLSALGGAILVSAADIAVRFSGPGPEMKLGVVTALLGAPFFLLLVLDTRRRLL